MDSEKVKEIKEKLKKRYYYLDQAYSDHLAYGGKGDDKQEEEIYFLRDVLTLINEFESENERLKEQNGALSCDLDYANEKLTNAEIEVDDYKDRIADLEKENTNCLKQFAERLKEKMGVREYMGVKYKQGVFSENDIDETLKEFLL